MLIVEPVATNLPRRKRRSWTLEEKRRIVDESLKDGASIAEIARCHDLNANQLFTWRRQFGFELDTASVVTTILPVTITPECEMETGSGGGSQMEIVLAGGDRIIVWADVQTAALSQTSSPRRSRVGGRRCATPPATHRPPPLHPPSGANQTARTNFRVDKSWGQGQKPL